MFLQRSKKHRTSASPRRTNTRRAFSIEPLEQRRVLAAGSLDPTFGNGGIVTTDFLGTFAATTGAAAVTNANGKIIVVGGSSAPGGTDIAVVRYNGDGSLDSTFGDDGHVLIDVGTANAGETDVAVQADGRIVVCGAVGEFGNADFFVARLNDDGSLDTSFDGDGKQTIDFGANVAVSHGLVVGPDDKTTIVGTLEAALPEISRSHD
jgi:uncharacterized delta-60 repeat protein